MPPKRKKLKVAAKKDGGGSDDGGQDAPTGDESAVGTIPNLHVQRSIHGHLLSRFLFHTGSV
jgi:hypothetical protein